MHVFESWFQALKDVKEEITVELITPLQIMSRLLNRIDLKERSRSLLNSQVICMLQQELSEQEFGVD